MKIDVSKLAAMAPKPSKNNVIDNKITKEDATMSQNTNINATVNANSKEDNNMSNANISTGKKTAGQFTIEYQQSGYEAETPIVDGESKPMLTYGYVSEADRQRCRDLIRDAYIATNGNDYAVMGYIRQAMMVAAAGIKPTETVMIEEYECLIDYDKKAIYLGDELIADLEDQDTTAWPDVAIKAVLVTKAKSAYEEAEINRRIAEADEANRNLTDEDLYGFDF